MSANEIGKGLPVKVDYNCCCKINVFIDIVIIWREILHFIRIKLSLSGENLLHNNCFEIKSLFIIVPHTKMSSRQLRAAPTPQCFGSLI